MQKLITVTIDTKQLTRSAESPFSIDEVDGVNDLLADGWEIEEWDFLKDDASDGELILMVTLTDDHVFEDEEEEMSDDFDFGDEEEEEEMEEEEYEVQKNASSL